MNVARYYLVEICNIYMLLYIIVEIGTRTFSKGKVLSLCFKCCRIVVMIELAKAFSTIGL